MTAKELIDRLRMFDLDTEIVVARSETDPTGLKLTDVTEGTDGRLYMETEEDDGTGR